MELLATRCYYKAVAYAGAGDGLGGTWYSQYYGVFACRQFIVRPGEVLVAPYDLCSLEAAGLQAPPASVDVVEIGLAEFEEVWERVAQPRLTAAALAQQAPVCPTPVLYVRDPFPAELKCNEGSSMIYTEWVDRVARRYFEAFADHTLVAPYDSGYPEDYEFMVRAIVEGVDDAGEPIDEELHPVQISHREFEEQWEQHALPRLRTSALSSGT